MFYVSLVESYRLGSLDDYYFLLLSVFDAGM
jgi:hypothetical protein